MSSRPVMLTDLDVVLRKDLTQWVSDRRSKTGKDAPPLFAQMEGQIPGAQVNTGLLVFDRHHLPLLADWAVLSAEALGDKTPTQDAMNVLLGATENLTELRRPSSYPLAQFLGKHRATVTVVRFPGEVAGFCGNLGEYTTHYNCVSDKLAAMIRNGDWHNVSLPALPRIL